MAKRKGKSDTLELLPGQDPAADEAAEELQDEALEQARAIMRAKGGNGGGKRRGGAVAMQVDSAYGAEQIQVLKGLEAVRQRPAMYIGSTGSKGLHHLIYEVVDNSVDEAMAGHCDRITITLNADNSCTVTDNGRGIPVKPHPDEKVSTLQVVLSMLHAGGKFSGGGYKVSGGLHGVGVSVVNALSIWLKGEVLRGGQVHTMAFARGIKTHELESKPSKAKGTGTTIIFLPDPDIFEEVVFDFSTLAHRFQELAYLNQGLTIVFRDERAEKPKEEIYSYPGGLKAFVEHLNEEQEQLHKKVFYATGVVTPTEHPDDHREIQVEVAIQYNAGYRERTLAFANNINTVEGGTHLEGFKSALTRALNQVARRTKVLKEKDKNLMGDDAREGLTAVLSVKLPDPQFEGQTKTQLGNSYMKGLVDSWVYEEFSIWLEHNPPILKRLIQKGIQAQRAREAARAARDRTRKQSLLRTGILSGKLADCSEFNPDENELFIVEGDSAGGSAKQGRDRRFQAVLPLRGKLINVEKARIDKVLANNEISALITAVGTNISEEFAYDKRRYDKVIIMTDADVDGAHIRTLILTFFYRYMPEMITRGHIYIAQPPLFLVKRGKQYRYCLTEEDLADALREIGGKTEVTRFKGLGEMDAEELRVTTMDPGSRGLLRVEIDDAYEANETFEILMGDAVAPRREFIEQRAASVYELDI